MESILINMELIQIFEEDKLINYSKEVLYLLADFNIIIYNNDFIIIKDHDDIKLLSITYEEILSSYVLTPRIYFDDRYINNYLYKIYDNLEGYNEILLDLLEHFNIMIYNNDTVVIKNRAYGFCANFQYINILITKLYDKYKYFEIIWNNNTYNFKYHDIRLNNSFYLYMDNNVKNINLEDGKLLKLLNNELITDIVNTITKYDSWTKRENEELYKNVAHRREFHNIIYSRLSIKSHILDYVDSYWQENVPSNITIYGLHLRSLLQLEENCDKNITLEDLCMKTKNLITGDFKIYLSTDILPAIEVAQNILGHDNIIYRNDIFRCKSILQDSIPGISEPPGYKYGWDILTDVLLLSKTKRIFMRPSNICNFLVYYNPNIEIIFINN